MDTFLELYRADGSTLIAVSDDIHYLEDDFTPAATKRSLSSLILNLYLPETETYFLKVTGKGMDMTGDYELFVAIPEPTALGLIAMLWLALPTRRAARS